MTSKEERAGHALRLRGSVDGDAVLLVLREGTQVLGSARDSDLPVRSSGVSRRHASVTLAGAEVTVRDLGSKNGTFVNGLRVEEARLSPRDWLQVGPVKLLLEAVEGGDARLALAIDRPAPAASATPAQIDTDTCARAPAAEPAGAIELLERVLPLVLDGRLHEALDALVAGLGASGIVLLERTPGNEAITLASAGRLPDLRALDALPVWHRAGVEASPLRDAPGGGSPSICAFRPGEDGAGHALVVAGDVPRPDLVLPVLRLVLHAAVRDRNAPKPDGRGRGPRPGRSLIFPPGTVRGRSPAMLELERRLRAIAVMDLPVLVLGETGSGKELVARALHLSSDRSRGPFVALNCAAIPAELLETELFGVVSGAATGVTERRGALERAGGGVLFLDEVGDLAQPLQAKLLRALQEKEVLPVGAESARAVDVRLVSATNGDLESRIAGGSFRRDLYYRIAGATLHVPPLRERREELAPLVQRFLNEAVAATGRDVRGITVNALAGLERAPWPGNVRQLRHLVHELVALCPEGQAIDSTLLPGHLAPGGPGPAGGAPPGTEPHLDRRIERLEREAISEALERAGGNRSLAARTLGLSRNGLLKKLRRLDLGRA